MTSSRLGKFVLPLGIILLYPGFFLYHSAVAVLGIPQFLGGYYGMISVCLFPLVVLATFFELKSKAIRFGRQDALFAAMLGLMVSWVMLHALFGKGYQSSMDVVLQALSIVFFWVVNYLLFRSPWFDQRWFKAALVVSFIVMLLISLAYQDKGFFYARRISASGDEEGIATYQSFARSAIVTTILLMTLLRERWLPWILGSGLVLLFVLGARSEFASFAAVGLLILVLRMGRLRLGVLVVPTLMVAALVLLDYLTSEYSNSRIVRLGDLSHDNSYLTRVDYTMFALQTVMKHPIMGDFGSQVFAGGTGTYAHNALSAWVTFGLLGFIMFACSLLVPVGSLSVRMISKGKQSEISILAFAFAIFSLIMALFAKSVFFPCYAIGWALYSADHEKRLRRARESTGMVA